MTDQQRQNLNNARPLRTNNDIPNGLLLEPTRNTPYVHIDYVRGTMEFKGRSSPQDAIGFFKPIFDSLGTLKNLSKIKVTFNMEYFNTSSAKCIFNVFRDLSILSREGAKVEVDWMFDEYDDDMKEIGTDIEDLTSLNFNYLPYN